MLENSWWPLMYLKRSTAVNIVNVRLLDELSWYGVEPAGFVVWLHDRGQIFGGVTHSERVTHGSCNVHGSILGPVLFFLFA